MRTRVIRLAACRLTGTAVICAIAGTLALLCCAILLGCPAKTPLRGIVLITLDTARGDLFDWSRPDEFPNIKALFADGVRFDQAISASPVTGPAHASLFTGLRPTEHGVLSNHFSLDAEHTTLAERLQALGYQTGAFVSCSVLRRGRGFEQGFDHYDAKFEKKDTAGPFERPADRTTSRAIRWLGEVDERPFFLWLHFFDAHAPYAPPREFRPEGFAELDADPTLAPTIERLGRLHKSKTALPRRQVDYYRALYRGQLEFIDQEIGRLHQSLTAQFEGGVTYVLAADHGEELAEHMNFFEHNLSLYDGVLRVPLAISSPGLAAERVSAQVDPGGLVASLLELIGQPVPSEILPSLLSETGRRRPQASAKELHAFVRPWAATLRIPPWKYFYWEDGREELYNVAKDPGEQTNLATQEPDRLAAMRAQFKIEVLPRFASPEVERQLEKSVDPATLEMLRALGYH